MFNEQISRNMQYSAAKRGLINYLVRRFNRMNLFSTKLSHPHLDEDISSFLKYQIELGFFPDTTFTFLLSSRARIHLIIGSDMCYAALVVKAAIVTLRRKRESVLFFFLVFLFLLSFVSCWCWCIHPFVFYLHFLLHIRAAVARLLSLIILSMVRLLNLLIVRFLLLLLLLFVLICSSPCFTVDCISFFVIFKCCMKKPRVKRKFCSFSN